MAGGAAADGDDSGAERSVREQWTVVLGVTAVSAALAAYEISPASVTPLVRDSLGVGATEAGLVVSVMFGVGVFSSLPTGALLDRTNSRTVVAVAVAVALVAGGWGWVAAERGSYPGVLASRALGGIAYIAVWNAGIDVVSRTVAAEYRATAVGTFTASGPVGFAVGQSTSPVIAASFGWPAISVAFTAASVVGLAVFWVPSRGLGHADGGPAPSLAEFAAVLRLRSVWLAGLLGFLAYALYLFVNSWAPSYLTDEVGLALGVSGVLVAVFPAVGVGSRVAGGVLSDRLFEGRRRPVLLGSFVATAPCLFALAALRVIPVLVAALLVAGFAVQLTLGLAFAYVRELVEPRVAATAVAFLTAVGLAGAFVAPIAGGALVAAFGYEPAFLLAGALSVVGVAAAWVLPEP
ncbi:MFS transporter [Halobacterium yunchengense]|uniref:MFS transporter n=1 Tax=Halobacterium yunchengense TaxID=3108497 RepID=UPI00300AB6F6